MRIGALASILPLFTLSAASGEELFEQAQVHSAGAIRVSFRIGRAPQPAASIFLVGEDSPVNGTAPGLTLAGSPDRWTLKGPSGETWMSGSASAAAGGVQVAIDWRSAGPPGCYGSGNDVPSLLHQGGKSRVGNGIAVIPYLWCTDGCGILTVGESDRAPASWVIAQTNAEGGSKK